MSIFAGRQGRFIGAFRNRNVILPNLITILGLLFGLYSIVLSINGKFVFAAVALIVAALFDALDGKVARLVKGTSEFGVQLDSLCDLVSFGVAPAFLVYLWVLAPFGRVGTMAVFLFVACGALRLARFNVQTGTISSTFFVGLPIPAAAAYIASVVLFVNDMGLDIDKRYLGMFLLISIYSLGILMVSTVPFYSFKKNNYMREKPFNALVIIVALVAVIGFNFEKLFFITIFLYIVISLLVALFKIRKKNGDLPDGKPAIKE